MPKYPRDGEYVFQVENASGSQLLDAPGSGMYDAPITAIWDLQTDFRELAPKPPKATNRYLVPATQSERKKRKDKPWDENLAGFGRYRAGMAGAKDAGVHYDSARPKAYMSVERLPLSPRKMQGRFRQSYVPGSALGGLQALQKKMEARSVSHPGPCSPSIYALLFLVVVYGLLTSLRSGSEVELVVSASMSSSSASSSTSFFSSSEYDSGNLWTLDSKFGPSPALSTLTRPLSPLKMDPSADGPSVYDNTFGEAGTLQLNLEPRLVLKKLVNDLMLTK